MWKVNNPFGEPALDKRLWLLLIPAGAAVLYFLSKDDEPVNPSAGKEPHLGLFTEQQSNARPETGRTYPDQSDESYCLECIEGHTMLASTEMRHATDRFRAANEMTLGVTDKVRGAIEEMSGIVKDVKDTEDASPEVKEGLNQILDEVRWIRKDYGLAGKGLTTGHGTAEDLNELKSRIQKVQQKAYDLVSKCPTCHIIRN